jgi:hypothetical protein
MVEFFIETSVDKLLDLVRKRKRIKISEASKILKVTQKQIDEWVFTLEDKGIVELKYPVLGEPEIVLKEVAPEEVVPEEKKKVKLETRIIPGKPIKKEELPKFEPSKEIPEYLEKLEVPKKEIKTKIAGKIIERPKEKIVEKPKVSISEHAKAVERIKALENRISKLASQRAEEISPKSVYVNEKLKFLESKLHEFSRKLSDVEKEGYGAEGHVLKKIDTLENRLGELSRDIGEEKEIISETKGISERLESIENKISIIAHEIDIAKFKEELFEILLIISTLKDKNKIIFYLNFFEKLVKVMKVKKLWDEVDEELMKDTIKGIAENWREYEQEELAKIFEEWLKKNIIGD